jgi:hypothetical protein
MAINQIDCFDDDIGFVYVLYSLIKANYGLDYDCPTIGDTI